MVREAVPLNLVPISGMQGTGKSTLIEDFLKAPEGILGSFPYLATIHYSKCEMTTFDDIMERQIRRIAKHVIDWRRAIQLAHKFPNCMIITDRCYHDAECYIQAFYALDWLTTDENDYLRDLLYTSFSPWDVEQIKPFFLNPPLSFIKENLSKRKDEQGMKWKEDNDDYLEAVFRSYNYYFSQSEEYGIPYIEKGTNEFIPGYECFDTSRVSRMMRLRNYLIDRWKVYCADKEKPN